MTTQWEKVHVFISSTFKDMHAERDYLVKRVFPKLSVWCERRRLRLVDIDLRWGVTEQDAQNRNVIKVCLDTIDACRPFFLCFLGQRRGWVPTYDPNKSEDDNQIPLSTIREFPDLAKYAGSTSATELEIVHALVDPLHRGRLRDPEKPGEYYEPVKFAFFYLREDSYIKQIDPPELGKIYTNESNDDDWELEKWRTEKIPATGRPRHTYSARWDPKLTTPELGLPGRLTDFQCQASPLDEAILNDLQEAITARYPDHVEFGELTDLQKEMDQQEQFLYASSEGFISRGDDFKDLDEYVKGSSNQLFVLTAPAGMGKSTLLANWIEHYRSDHHVDHSKESIHFRFIGQSDRSTTVYSLLNMLLRELKEVAGKITEEIPDDPQKQRQELPKLLEAAGKKGKTILVLDALNQLGSGLSDLSWLAYQLPANIKLIVSIKSDDPGAEGLLQQMQGKVIHAQVKPFDNLEDRRKLVNEYLKKYLKTLDTGHLETLIQSNGAERPLFLKVVLSELRVFGAFGNLREKIRSDFGETPVSAFAGVLKRLENDPAYSPIDPKQAVPLIFGLMAHTRQNQGLSAEELTGLLIQALGLEDNEASRQAASDCVYLYLRQVRSFLAHRDGCNKFFFESFEIAARERYVAVNSEDPLPKQTAQAWHRLLAEYFTPQPLYLDPEKKMPNLRKLTEMVYQQAHAGLGEQVEKALLDYKYLEAKLTGLGVQELIGDYELIPKVGVSKEKEKSLSLLQGALRLSTYVLNKNPLQLPGQITGRLLGIKDSNLRELLDQIRREVEYPWLRPLNPCLDAPGGVLLRTQEHNGLVVGTTGWVVAVALTSDGRRAMSGSQNNKLNLKLWDLETGECLRTLVGHTGFVNAVEITQDGRLAISGSGDKTIKMWDLESGACLHTLAGHANGVNDVAMTQDGRYAVSASGDGTVKMWNLQTGECMHTLMGHEKNVTAVSITPDGRWAISGSTEFTQNIKMWDLVTGQCLRTLEGHTGGFGITGVVIMPDGKRLVSAGKDQNLKVWDLENGNCILTLKTGHTGWLFALALTPDGHRAITGSRDNTLKVWNLETGECLRTLEGHTDGIASVALTPDGRTAVSGSWDRTLKVWNLDGGASIRIMAGLTNLTLAPDGQRAISGSSEGLKVWDLDSGECLRILPGVNYFKPGTLTPDGLYAVSGSLEGFKVWDLETGKCLRTLESHKGWASIVTLTPDGRRAVSGSSDNILKMWDLETGDCLCTLDGHTQTITDMALTPDGRKAVSVSNDGTMKVWELKNGICLHTLPWNSLDSAHGKALTITPDGRWIILRDFKNLKVFNIESGEIKCIMEGQTGMIYTMAVAPDGKKTVSGSDAHVKVWDIETGICLHTLIGHTNRITAALLTPDGKKVVSTSFDRNLKVWDLESGTNQATFECNGALECATVAPDGLTLTASDQAGHVFFLHLENVTASAPIFTAWNSNGALAFGCQHCRTWSEIPMSALGNEIPCPKCGKSIRLNPFTIEGDWEPIAGAWKGKN